MEFLNLKNHFKPFFNLWHEESLPQLLWKNSEYVEGQELSRRGDIFFRVYKFSGPAFWNIIQELKQKHILVYKNL